MHFIDEATVTVTAGKGGDGSTAMRREAHRPRGGPAGGDGGRGGSVILVADPGLSTLLDYRIAHHIRAENGQDGGGNDRYGRSGVDRVLPVPVGTVAFDANSGELICDLSHSEARAVVAAGGQGGRGNIHFATPWNQAPRQAEKGTPGEVRELRLELKSVADVGLVGLPNAGKSTLISVVSRCRPKIAAYPFTTLVPNLGVVEVGPDRSFVMADLPGLVQGAADGIGLGHRFLRHAERARVFLHLIDGAPLEEERDPVDDFERICHELRQYAPELGQRPQIAVMTKMDVPSAAERMALAAPAFRRRGIPLLGISAATHQGLRPLLESVWQLISAPPE